MATRLLLITVQTIACSQFNISSGVTAPGKESRDTEGNAAACVGTCKAYHQLTNAFPTAEKKGRFLKPVISRKDIHIVICQQMEASNGTQRKAGSLDEFLTLDEVAMNTSSIAFYSSRTFLVWSPNFFHRATLHNVSLPRGKGTVFSFRCPWYQQTTGRGSHQQALAFSWLSSCPVPRSRLTPSEWPWSS